MSPGVIAAGIARLAGLVAAAAAIAGGAGLAVGAFKASDLSHSLALGLYFGGGLLVLFALLSGARPGGRYISRRGEDLGPVAGGTAQGLVYVVVGVALLGLGVLAETVA